jgi:hypothetical protein
VAERLPPELRALYRGRRHRPARDPQLAAQGWTEDDRARTLRIAQSFGSSLNSIAGLVSPVMKHPLVQVGRVRPREIEPSGAWPPVTRSAPMAGTDWGQVLGGIVGAGVAIYRDSRTPRVHTVGRGFGGSAPPPGWTPPAGYNYGPMANATRGYGPAFPNAPTVYDYAGGSYGSDMMNASWTNANLMLPSGPTEAGIGSALVPIAGAAVRVATPALRSAVAFLSRWIAPAAAVEVASEMIRSGAWPKQAVYNRNSDNAVVGVMRGDIKAIKRVKRQARRLQKIIRAAGVGRRSLPRRRRRAA